MYSYWQWCWEVIWKIFPLAPRTSKPRNVVIFPFAKRLLLAVGKPLASCSSMWLVMYVPSYSHKAMNKNIFKKFQKQWELQLIRGYRASVWKGRREGVTRGQEGITKRCRLTWLTNSALLYEPNYGGGGGCGVSAREYSCTYTGAQINFGDLTRLFGPKMALLSLVPLQGQKKSRAPRKVSICAKGPFRILEMVPFSDF
jgi:hypothetical protein